MLTRHNLWFNAEFRMLNYYCHSLRCLNAVAARVKTGWLVRTLFYSLCTLCATCDAATLIPRVSAPALPPTKTRQQQLTEVWREAFPLVDDEMAPLSSTRGLPVNKPTAPWAGVRPRLDRPHPAVARIVVPEQGAISYGSGTLIDVRENFGLVITNWHVVRDASEAIEVIFPDGFTSKARALKVDSDWDLAALVIWQPEHIEPVSIAPSAPRPGDQLTICGYGQGNYRCATGRCTQYYAPRLDFPRHMVELDVEARQGDSGGPIFNERGELAGVLFGAGQGTTLGSFGGRVGAFLATLAPDIGRAEESLVAQSTPQPSSEVAYDQGRASPQSRPATLSPRDLSPRDLSAQDSNHQNDDDQLQEFDSVDFAAPATSQWPADTYADSQQADTATQAVSRASATGPTWQSGGRRVNLFEQSKTALAAVGLVTIVVQVLRVAR